MFETSEFPEGSVEAAAASNFNSGNWVCYFSERALDLPTVWGMLREASDRTFDHLEDWGPAFAYVGDQDGALMFFTGPVGGIIAHTGFTPRGTRDMNETLQNVMGPRHVPGLFVTPLIRGEVESSFDGSPIRDYLGRSSVAPFRDSL